MKKEIINIIKEWKQEAGVNSIILVSASSGFNETIKICTDKPGLMIGYKGDLVNKYREKFKKINPNLVKIEFVETDSWFIK